MENYPTEFICSKHVPQVLGLLEDTKRKARSTWSPTSIFGADSGASSTARYESSLATCHFMHVRRPGRGAIPRPRAGAPSLQARLGTRSSHHTERDAVHANKVAKQIFNNAPTFSLLGTSRRPGHRCFGAVRPG